MINWNEALDWTREQALDVVKRNNGDVTLDCEHSSISNMKYIARCLEEEGYQAVISSDLERIYVSR